jgi:hypothetical protein
MQKKTKFMYKNLPLNKVTYLFYQELEQAYYELSGKRHENGNRGGDRKDPSVKF